MLWIQCCCSKFSWNWIRVLFIKFVFGIENRGQKFSLIFTTALGRRTFTISAACSVASVFVRLPIDLQLCSGLESIIILLTWCWPFDFCATLSMFGVYSVILNSDQMKFVISLRSVTGYPNYRCTLCDDHKYWKRLGYFW